MSLTKVQYSMVASPVANMQNKGGTNVLSAATGPTVNGNVYKTKLLPGLYKLRAWSDLNQLTVKSVSLALWD